VIGVTESTLTVERPAADGGIKLLSIHGPCCPKPPIGQDEVTGGGVGLDEPLPGFEGEEPPEPLLEPPEPKLLDEPEPPEVGLLFVVSPGESLESVVVSVPLEPELELFLPEL